MMDKGKQGEKRFTELVTAKGLIVNDVTKTREFFAKDVDFFVTNPATGNTRTFEVKWCYGISKYGNLFLEFINPRSKQWNGEGWWLHCKADFLAYGDAVNNKFYIFNMEQLRERVEPIFEQLEIAPVYDGSVGRKLPLARVKDLVLEVIE